MEIRKLTRREYETLHKNFPNGGDFYTCKKIPDWVWQVSQSARRKLIEAGMLLPYAESEVVGLGAGSEFKIVYEGRLVCADVANGTTRIAMIFGEEDVWLIAAWDDTTGEEVAFPVKGCAVQWPGEDKKEEIAIMRQEALQKAEEDLERMKTEYSAGFVRQLIISLGVVILAVILRSCGIIS